MQQVRVRLLGSLFAAGLTTGCASLGLGDAGFPSPLQGSAEGVPIGPVPPQFPTWTNEKGLPTLAPLMRQITPAVVNISAVSRVPPEQHPYLSDPMFRRFLELFEVPIPDTSQPSRRQSVGSGFIVDARQGYVMTNYHLIEDAEAIVVTLKDGRSFPAQPLARDSATDVALLRIAPVDAPALQLGNSDALQVGDFVIAIGNPFGIGQTVTSGIVSAIGHDRPRVEGVEGLEGFKDFIQTDASINPGNSGGPLINLAGEVVGINTAIVGPTGASVGIGFAVPSNLARAAMQRVVRK